MTNVTSSPKTTQKLPPQISLKSDGQRLSIYYRWFQDTHIFILFFAVLWNALLFFFYINTELIREMGQLFYLFPILHSLVGLGLLYYALTGIFNVTTVLASQNSLIVKHRPLPWLGNRRLSRQQLEQLFVRERISDSQSGRLVTYQLCCFLKGMPRQEIVLVKGLESAEQARFIEREIETYLQIRDYPVQGEYPKPKS